MIAERLSAARPRRVIDGFAWLDVREIACVRRQNVLAQRAGVRRLAVTLSLLGAGGLYPLIVAALFWAGGPGRTAALWTAALSALASHLIYPFFKAFAARARPFVTYGDLVSLVRPLDRYSFPSGHAMTAAAVFVALGASYPAMIPPAVLIWLLLAWAQLACAHHYPSDIVAAAAIGGSAGVLITRMLVF